MRSAAIAILIAPAALAQDGLLWNQNGNNIYYDAGYVGIYTMNPVYPLHVVRNTTRTGYFLNNAASGTTFALYGQNTSTGGTGLYGLTSATSGVANGVWGSTSSTGGRALYGTSNALSGINYGLYASNKSPTGYGSFSLNLSLTGLAYGSYARTSSTTGVGSAGFANATSGKNYGTYGWTGSTQGIGAYGGATASTGPNYGVWGQSSSSGGFGVYGWGKSPKGNTCGVYGKVDSPTGTALYGYATSGGGGSNYGLYAYSPNLGSGYGAMIQGNFAATGMKSFKIDHPLDPANKFLYHYCTEGPQALNIYRGNVALGPDGSAWVDLPEYFEAINTDVTYQLTPIGGPASVYVASEVANNRFRVAGGAPGMKVSWVVTGVRSDAAALANGAPVEQDKPESMRGRYFHPELYGRAADRVISPARDPEDRPAPASPE